MQVPVRNIEGEVLEQVEIGDDIFAVPFNEAVVHQAMVRQLANARLGTADTKTRGEVSGSTRKLYPQKGTGRARRGDIKSPLLVGGGIAFGPHPRSYRQQMPKKMHRLALKCLLSAKAAEENLIILKELQMEQPKTKEMIRLLKALGVDSSALIVTPEVNSNVIKSARNLPKIKTICAPELNVVDLLTYRFLIMPLAALRQAEQIWGIQQKEAQG